MAQKTEDSFARLLAAIREHKGAVRTSTLRKWQNSFDSLWTRTDEKWSLVSLLPISKKYSLGILGNNIQQNSELPAKMNSASAFMATTGCKHLGELYCEDQLGPYAFALVDGCINLLREARNASSGIAYGDLSPHVCRTLSHYPGTLASMQGYHNPVRIEKESFVVDDSETISYAEMSWPNEQQIAAVIAKDERHDDFLEACAIESAIVSETFINKLDRDQSHPDKHKFNLWASYLVPKHGFDFCWRFLTATQKSYHGGYDESLFGKTVDERMGQLRQTLLDNIPSRRGSPDFGWQSSNAWRETFVALAKPIASLLELERSNRTGSFPYDEAWVRQNEIIELVSEHPQLLPTIVSGILNHGRSHWDLLDAIVLALPQTEVSEVLTEYLDEHHLLHAHYHARILLAHARGEQTCLSQVGAARDTGILSAVENLITVSRTRLPHDRSQIWLGNVAIESLWFGAMQAANKEFVDQFDSQFGQDEHEHVAMLADALARHLQATNATARVWLDSHQSVPAFLDISVRRFPKTAKAPLPQEGGSRGLQADLAFLVNCEIPGLAIASRVTLLQAKKVERTHDGKTWSPVIRPDQKQLSSLISLSSDAHYMFMLHSELGYGPLIFPARTVKDIMKAQERPYVPLPIILRASKNLPEFLLHDVIGLWTGDTSPGLVETVKQGDKEGQGPRVLIEITLRNALKE